MKKGKRIVSSLMIASYLANQPINVFAEELRNIYISNLESTSEVKENSETKAQNNLLDEVYLNASKSSSGSGVTADTAVNTFQEALDLVSNYGSIYVSGEVDIPDDIHMPNKLIFINQQKGGDEAKLRFEKKLCLNKELYINDVDVEFSSTDKDCIFINGYALQLTNSEVIGKPNVFLGSEDKDIKENIVASLRILNDNPSNNFIGNITLGGKDNHTIEDASITLKGINVEGVIDGSNTINSSNILIETSASLNKIKNVRKVDTYDYITLDIKDGLENIMELYVHGTIKLKNGIKINADYIYGSIILDVEEPSNGTLTEGNYIKSRKITGSVILSDNLIRKGYRINRIDGDGSVELNIFNKQTTNISTNYEPVIKNLSKIRIEEGQTVDLKIGVKAWDFEDGDITENIVFPEIDSETLPTGRHELAYKVTDSNNNTTTMNRIIYVLPKNASYEDPKIIGENQIELKVSQVDIFNSGHKLVGITVPADTRSINVIGEVGKPSSGQDGRYAIIYELKDNNNNITTIEKTVIVTNRLPEIVANDVTIKAGEQIDLLTDSRIGLNATDYEDGDKKANIVVESNGGLNEKNPVAGDYTVVYKVVDDDNNIARKQIKITVTSPVINVTGITLNSSNLNLKTGKTATLIATVSPSNATNKELTWTSNNTNVVTVDSNGKVTAVGVGSATITVTAKDGSGKTAACKITVLSNNAPKINGANNTTIKVGQVDKFDLLSGITVADDHDNDLKATVVSGKLDKPSAGTNKNYTITYKATDSDGNTTTATRVITVTNQLPVIEGLGDIIINEGEGDGFNFLYGITATDLEDGDLINSLELPSIDLSSLTEGTYSVEYKVIDSDKNTTISERKIIVLSKKVNEEIKPETKPDISEINGVVYQTHIEDYGWQDWKSNGEVSGTTGESKRLEGIKIKINDIIPGASIKYRTHVQDYGWQDWKSNGEMSGTSGESKRLEGIEIKLENAPGYSIEYRTHVQDYGWQEWKRNGEMSGTTGESKRLEGIEIRIVKDLEIEYRTHVQDYGWQEWKSNGEMSGTTGEAKRLEGIEIKVENLPEGAIIRYRTHVQDYGWQEWKSNGEMSGTSGESKRLEGIEIKLENAPGYSIEYRTHVQDYGWQDWKSDGEMSGTTGESKRLEGIEIRILKK